MKTKPFNIGMLLILIAIFNIPYSQSQTFETTVVGTETYSARPGIFADSLGHLHVTWVSDDLYAEILRYATNQSGGWNYSRRVTGTTGEGHFVPVIVTDKYGFAYISYRYSPSSGFPSIRYITNKNLTTYNWAVTTQLSGSTPHFHESSIEVGSDQNVHVFAQEDEEFEIDASRIFYNNLALADTVFKDNIVQYYSTTIDQNDDLHAVGYRGDHLFYKKYSSSTWSAPVIIDGVGISAYQPSITCDKSGKQHVVFATSSGIYYLNNTSGSWSSSTLISGTIGGIYPDVVVDENGKAFVAYYTPGSSGYLYFTTNHGGSWITPKTIADIGDYSTVDVTHADSKIALDLKNSTVNMVYVQNGNQVTVASTDDYELRSSKSTDLTSTLTSTAGTPTIDTLTTFDASSTQTLLQFTITDVANDGEPTKVEAIVVERGPGMSDDVCFNDLFSSLTIEEVGQSSESLSLYSSRAIIGSTGSIWKSISEGGSKSFILKGVLNSSLSSVLDKDFQVKINGLYDVITDNSGSLMTYSSTDVISDTLRIKEYILSGSGTEGDPYLVASLNDLRAVSEASSYWNDYLKQTADIDASATSTWNSSSGFSPIGNTTTQFTGSYDGDGNTIDGLYINQEWGMYQGFFGYLSSANVQDLSLSGLNITSYMTTGGLVANSLNSTISNCNTKGSITGNSHTGGLCGDVNGGTLSNCYSIATVSGTSYSGGLASTLVGSSTITNSFSTGSVSGSSYTGGLIGNKAATATATNSFWDITTSGQTSSELGTGKTTAEMKTLSTFTTGGWDFVGETTNGTNYYWSIDGTTNSGYPFLSWEVQCWIGTAKSTDWFTATNWHSGAVPTTEDDVSIANTSTMPSIGGSTTANCNDLVVASGSTFTIDYDGKLTVGNNFTNNGTFTISSTSSGTGSLLVIGTATGSVIMERYLEAATWDEWDDGWHFLSSTVADYAIQDNFTVVTAADYDFYAWSEVNNIWVNFKNTGTSPTFSEVNGSTTFELGHGYLAAFKTTDTKDFTGTINVSDVEITGLTITGSSNDYRSWHLLGNPFTSGLAWYTDWTSTNIAGTAQIWNELGKSYTAITEGSVIPATNGFMVQASGGTGEIIIPEAFRTHGGTFYKSSEFPLIKLKANNLDSPSFQESQLLFNPESTNDWDMEFDSDFLAGYAPLFYSKINGEPMAVNSMPNVSESTSIPFTFIKNEGLNFSIEMYDVENMNMDVWLHDNKLNREHNLTENPVYVFTSFEGDNAQRFVIHFSPLGIEEPESAELIQIWAASNSINILNPNNSIGEVRLINMYGQEVQRSKLNGDSNQRINVNVATGYYIVNTVTKTGVVNTKIYLKKF